MTVGGSEAIDLALRTILNDGDEVICPEPCFVSLHTVHLMANGVPVRIPLREENEFRLTRGELGGRRHTEDQGAAEHHFPITRRELTL